MASCTKCGANLIAQARFCASCGGPVTSSSIAPAPPAARPAPRAVPDAFARTILSDGVPTDSPAAPPAAVSPMAASVMSSQSQPPPARASAMPAPQAPVAPAAPVMAAQYAAPAQQPASPFPPGSLVLVYWADGNRYPGTVLQVAQYHVFVAFPNGAQQWIDARYVQPGR